MATGRPLNREMSIPRPRAEFVFHSAAAGVVGAFTLLAVVNVCNGDARIASSTWLVLVTVAVWAAAREAGGWRRFLVDRLGDLCGRPLVESDPADARPRSIRLGFRLLGRSFFQKCIPLDRIESVEWKPGQATALAGRDMNDWNVWVWFDHGDPSRSEQNRRWSSRKPDQDFHGVGPTLSRDRAQALGLSLVAFLRDAGANLVPGDSTTCFVTSRDSGGERIGVRPDAATNGGPAPSPGGV